MKRQGTPNARPNAERSPSTSSNKNPTQNTLLLIFAFIQHGESGATFLHDFLPHKFILSLLKLIVLDLDFLFPQKFQSYHQREAQAYNIAANDDLSGVG
jgi:hypothetical protein